jgi:FkbM family methyltransferase
MFSEAPTSAQSFYNMVLVQSIGALKLNTFLDNFDAARFNLDGKDHSKTFSADENAFYFDWFFKHHESLYSAYAALGNEKSKHLYLYLVAFRLAGHFSVRLPVDFANMSAEYEHFRAAEKAAPSKLASNGMFGQLKHFDFVHRDHHYRVDCLGLEYYLVRGQYSYRAGRVSIAAVPGDHVIDGGACMGDTAAVFSAAVGPSGKVYAFDPVADHLAILDYNAKQSPISNVVPMPYGLSNRNVIAEPIVLNHYAPGFSSRTSEVPLRSLDFLVNTQEIEKIDFIKLDVEGAEMDCLRGARESIRRFKPKLAISLYHKPNDLFEIVLHIKSQFPFYSCYIEHYTIHAEETVLYCHAQPS